MAFCLCSSTFVSGSVMLSGSTNALAPTLKPSNVP